MTDEPTETPAPEPAQSLAVTLLAGGRGALLEALVTGIAETADMGFLDLLEYLEEREHGPECEHPELCRRGGVMLWSAKRGLTADHVVHVLASAVNMIVMVNHEREAAETERDQLREQLGLAPATTDETATEVPA